uniref:Transposase (Putative), gypsy type n=1 Tax=Tanacetum cinerariifolium TaxID=118510 RepID=A0A6L2P0Y3_TANCI|nr:hypothetical protein [Tanacetum cinerariifolium]
MSKNDMKDRICAISKNNLKDLVKTYHIPLDIHPYFPNPGFTMDRLPGDAIGIYSEFLWFSGVHVPFLTFLLSVLKYFKNDVQRLCSCLIHLHEMREEVLVHSGLKMSIYDFMTFPSWSDAKVIEESHHLSLSLLSVFRRILLCRDLEAGSSAVELDQAEGTDEADLADLCAKIEDSLERDEGVSMRAVSAPTPRLGMRLGAPPSIAVVSAYEPSHVGTLAPTSTSGRSLSLGGVVASGCVGKSEAEVNRRQIDPLDCLARSALARDATYDQILDDYFGTATRGEEIDLTLFPLTPGPITCLTHIKDPNVCRKALDQTITLAELRRIESLLPLELSNHVNVLSALLNLDKKKWDVKLLRSEVTSLDSKLENLQRGCDALGQENKKLQELTQTDAKLLEQALTMRDLQNELVREKSKSQGYKDAMDGLREEVTQFVGSGMESLVQKLLSSDKFHAALACVASLGINYGVEREKRMGRIDVEFEAAV